MLFNIEYNSDITFVFCHEYQTCSIIAYDPVIDRYGVVDTYCSHSLKTFDYPEDALEYAMMTAQYCTKEPEREVVESGDKQGFLTGVRSTARLETRER